MDRQLFAEMYDAHARAVYAYAVRMSADRAGAEDVVSLTFLEAWRLRDALDGITSHRAWLFGVATNVMRNSRRAARRHGDAMARLPPPDTVPDPTEAVVSRIPGVVLVPRATDAAGRTGIAVARVHNGERTEWIFDQDGLHLLGERTVLLKDSAWGKAGTPVTSVAIVARGVTDRAGQLPSG